MFNYSIEFETRKKVYGRRLSLHILHLTFFTFSVHKTKSYYRKYIVIFIEHQLTLPEHSVLYPI